MLSSPHEIEMEKQKPAMEKLLDSVLTNIAKSKPPLTINRKNEIENRFRQVMSNLPKSSHPPYAMMIRTAITELSEKRGSSEASISMYIKKEYAGLPWAHTSYLSHYLEKLIEKGEIVTTRSKCYKLLNLSRGSKEEPLQIQKHERDKLAEKTSVEKEKQSHEQQVGSNDVNEPKRQGLFIRLIRKPKGENETTKDLNVSKWVFANEKQEPARDRKGQILKEMVMAETSLPTLDAMGHEQPEKVSYPTSQQEKMVIMYNAPDHQPLNTPPITVEQSSQTEHKTRRRHLLRLLDCSKDINQTSTEETSRSSEEVPRTRKKIKKFMTSIFKPQQSQPLPQRECANQEKSLAIVPYQEETAMEPLLQSRHRSAGGKLEAKADKGSRKGHRAKRKSMCNGVADSTTLYYLPPYFPQQCRVR